MDQAVKAIRNERPIKRIRAQIRSKERKQCRQSDKGEEGAEKKQDADTDPTTGVYRIR